MASTISCFLLLGIVVLTNGNQNYYNKRSAGLIQKLSDLKGKYGLNFAHVEGIGSLPKHYKETHPKLKYVDHNPQIQTNKNHPADYNNIQMYNLLVAAKKHGMVARSRDKYCDQTDERKDILRICSKKPKEYHCSPVNECDKPSDECDEKNECDDSKEKKRFSKVKKHYYRTGNKKEHDTDDETAILLNDLEKLLKGNSKYRVFLGCVGKMCGGRSNRDGYDEGGDYREVQEEHLRCNGDRCGKSRDGDDDNVITGY